MSMLSSPLPKGKPLYQNRDDSLRNLCDLVGGCPAAETETHGPCSHLLGNTHGSKYGRKLDAARVTGGARGSRDTLESGQHVRAYAPYEGYVECVWQSLLRVTVQNYTLAKTGA